MSGEQQSGQRGEGRFEGGDARAHPREEEGGGRVQEDVGRVEPRRLQPEAQVVGPGNKQKIRGGAEGLGANRRLERGASTGTAIKGRARLAIAAKGDWD